MRCDGRTACTLATDTQAMPMLPDANGHRPGQGQINFQLLYAPARRTSKAHLAHAMGSAAVISSSTWRAAWSSVCVVTLVRKPSGASCASAGPVQGLVGKSVAGSSRPASSGTLKVGSQG